MEKDLAVDKIRDEMAANAKDLNVQYIGEQLTRYIMAHPADAPKFYAKGKSITGAMKKLEEYARAHKSGMMACVDPDRGMRIIFEYYEVMTGKISEPPKVAARSSDLDLDALLGGVG